MLRFIIFVALGLEAAFWLYLAGAGVADNLDFAKGMGHRVATVLHPDGQGLGHGPCRWF
jgi:hypothetical protein